MKSDDKKPEKVLGDLEGIRNLLDESEIPTLEQSIPELNERVDVENNFRVLLDTENSTETVEQQLARTHHEESPAPLALTPEPTDTADYDENPDFTFKLVETNDESEKQFSQIENIAVLDQQQLDIEQVAEQEFIDTRNEELSVSIIEDPEIEDTDEESFDEVEMSDLILNNAWIKVESLLMDNLPPQLSGAFLQLLNSRIEENKLQLFEELSLLDKETFDELLGELGIDQGF